MGDWRFLICILFLTSYLHRSHGCQIDGISLGPVPVTQNILDTFRGTIVNRSATNIESITNFSFGEGMTSGPYLDVLLEDSQFVLQTNNLFAQYEENEVISSISVTINFSCTGGGTSFVVFVVNIIDTNNNPPQFIPSDEFEYVVAPPLPPGFIVTGCLKDITVRDIDLTTSSIIFAVEDNPYFEIEFDAASSTVAKEFKAQLKTSTFIRSMREPIILRITATDVDDTGDPPLTTTATVRISGDTEFELPEEPVFSQTIYFANYTDDHRFIQSETIFLQQGFDEYVNFTLDGDYSSYFSISSNGNLVSIDVRTPLPLGDVNDKQIYLIVRADREYTSGNSATIVVHLPEETSLQFENVLYKGTIIDDTLQLSSLVLSQGYENFTVSVTITGDYATNFAAIVEENLVIITIVSLSNDMVANNSLIWLYVAASTGRSEANTVVSLEIIKDDNVTPVFDKPIYTGSYNSDDGLTMEPIYFVQGFDESVDVDLQGEYASLFQINSNGPTIFITSSTIPLEMYEEQRITLSIEATKPRTVGAKAAIIITLPSARELEFEEPNYRGTIQDNALALQTISLRNGYDENVRFSLSGEYSSYFNVTNIQNQVNLSLLSPLPDNVIAQNAIIALTLTASGLNAVATTTSLLLDILKEDTTTPLFNQNIYYGTYHGPSNIEIENIFLAQGFDEGISFRLDGADAQYFDVKNAESGDGGATITLREPIPEDVIFNEKVLLFNILADKALTVGSNAAVLIRFPAEFTESTIMRFAQNSYVGTLEENHMSLENIVLDTGFATGTEFILSGDYADYFNVSNTNNVVQISSNGTPPPEVMAENNFIVLTIEARRQRAISAWTNIILDIVMESMIQPVFNKAYYRGSYTSDNELKFEESIYLLEGYDETVIFELEGEQSSFFSVYQNNNSVFLVLDNQIPETVIENNSQLLFTILARKTNETNGQAVISIDLPQGVQTRFSQDYYKGHLENGTLSLETMVLQDFVEPSDLNYTLLGDYSDYFQVINQNGNFILELLNPMLNDVLGETNLLILQLQIEMSQRSIQTVIILEVKSKNELQFAFERPYYVGSYKEQEGLIFETPLRIANAQQDEIEFNLEGDEAEWFKLENDGNSAILGLANPIPQTVLQTKSQLIFVVTAKRSNTILASATIVITLSPENTTSVILGFDQVTYLGTIENNQTSIPAITLSEGYMPGIVFTLHGDLESFFNISSQGTEVFITLQSPIPEQLIPTNQIIILKIQASVSQVRPAYATMVLECVVDRDISIVELIFAEAYYTGSYTDTDGLEFTTPITLAEGYDASVDFVLGGDNAQWFGLVRTDNSLTLVLTSPIPAPVLANNQHLVFIVNAHRSGSTTARATIVISLTAEYTEGLALGFDRVTYFGTIEINQTSIPAITLSEGYVPGVVLTLHGDQASYFSISSQGTTVIVAIQSTIPEQSIPSNRMIILEMQASASGVKPAYATLVLECVVDGDISAIQLIFAEAYYTGTYTDTDGLEFTTPITLAEGYDASVEFVLEGDNAQWFGLVQMDNSLTLVLASPIPGAVLANNQHLVFTVNAHRSGSTTARATIVISLTAEYTEGLALGFDRLTYFGTIENNQTSIPAITLSEGYVPGVVLTLHGDQASYFSISSQGTTVIVAIQSTIPEQSIPSNRMIILEMQASASGVKPAYATLVLECVVDGDISAIQLIFAEAYYTGTYTDTDGLEFKTPITLAEGYDASVDFVFEGDNAQWFGLVQMDNSLTLVLTSPIPGAVLANNQHLVFTVNAHRSGSTTARATIVISLTAEYTVGLALGFDRVTYFGTIENNQTSIPAITLSEGYVPGVVLTLHGDQASYFSISSQGTTVIVAIQSTIPEQSIPANRMIILEMQASTSGVMPAYATLVLECVVNGDISVVQLIFSEAYYIGTYTDTDGLEFTTPITLAEGYDASVDFVLEGDNAQWFGLVQTYNSLTLVLTSPIPGAVLANNQHLVFIVNAHRSGSTTARATIVISLTADYTEGMALGFDRATYLGTIENNLTSIPAITLSEGFVPGVVFTLFGDLSVYFSISSQDSTVILTLQSPIPEQLIPTNRIIILEIQASASQAMPAVATIVITVTEDPQTDSGVSFDKIIYEGVLQNEVVYHEVITIIGYNGTTIELFGEYSSLFVAELSNDVITVRVAGSLTLPAGLTHLALELGAGNAKAVLILSVSQTNVPLVPVVTFSSTSYEVRVKISDTGLVGHVQASADNGEPVLYSLQFDNSMAHLQERLSINDFGELHLSAPVNSGSYRFQVIATTIFTQTTGNSTVYLTSEAITVCGDELVMPSLIVIDRDEEDPHYDLISSTYEGCHFSLANRWPLDQTWLYVNETGLHTTAIDREHESIAFMALSQVQVEITLHCDTDETRTKRSLGYESLGPYDYSTNKWVLSDTILYNSRRSFVNLIVNDINDNEPVFVGKEQEPIAVGYPVAGLEERVLPRSLAELQATDADIGENAALVYWSSEPVLAVAPSTGFVHIRDGASLENDARLTVHATDRNGQGLTGSIDIIVKLLDERNIVVVTIKDAFLDEENNVLSRLSESVGYDVKVLRAVVISEDQAGVTRNLQKATSKAGATLQLYIYGLIEREPVSVERLTTDIANAVIEQLNIASTVSLEDHLAGQEICVIPGRDTGLLASTIVLSVLLFIIIVLIAVWFFLRWRTKQIYDQFSDENSIVSRNDSVDQFPKPVEVLTKPRLNIEELKKSERRLQEMLDAPIEDVSVEPATSRKDSFIDIPPESETNAPIVIQSIDKLKDASDDSSDDEFGEQKIPKRKSVVTFNENVEKIIHVEDTEGEDDSSSPDYEIYQL